MPPTTIHGELRKIKKWERSAPNRLKSIEEDAVRVDAMLTALCWEVHDATLKAAERRQARAAQKAADGPAPELVDPSAIAPYPSSSLPPLQVRCFANLRCGEWYLPSASTFRGGAGLPSCTTHLPREAARVLWGYAEAPQEQTQSPTTEGPREGTTSDLPSSSSPPPPCSAAAFTFKPSPNVYFKSADSHYGKWQFSAVRLNLQLLQPYLVHTDDDEMGGDSNANVKGSAQPPASRLISVIVDATQQGKRFPDALSKTVPIWCLVVNEALYYHDTEGEGEGGGDGDADEERKERARRVLFGRARAMLPPSVPDSEVNSIALLLPSFVAVFKAQLRLNSKAIARGRLARPLKAAFVSCAEDDVAEEQLGQIAARGVQRCMRGAKATEAPASSGLSPHSRADSSSPPCYVDAAQCPDDVDTILLLCASGDTTKVRPRAGWFYVTGGADDHESWGKGLSPSLFWDNVSAILHPQGKSAPMPADVVITSLMEEVIAKHAARCKALAAGGEGEGDGSGLPTVGGSSSCPSAAHKWFPISPLMAVHCGPCAPLVAGAMGGSPTAPAVVPSSLFTGGISGYSVLVVGPSAVGSGGESVASIGPSAVKVLFEVTNKTGLQRAAHALFVAASSLILARGGAFCDDGRPLSPLIVSVAIPEHVPVAVAVLALLMTLMTSPCAPDAAVPLAAIEGRLKGSAEQQQEGHGGEDGEEVAFPHLSAAGHFPINALIAQCIGVIGESIAARNGSVTKEWVRSCHQRASTLCGGSTAPRSLMQQINQYFLTMDSFGKNIY